MVFVAPSILSADFSCLKEDIRRVEEGGADFIHVDVMDGRFVPNITVGVPVVKSLKSITSLPLDVHLMIEEPDKYINAFAEAGAHVITVHQEACTHLHRTVTNIKELGVKAGVALNPATPVELLDDILEEVDLVLIMLVNPGFGGQSMITSALKKVMRLKRIKKEKRLPFLIEVDGGVKVENAHQVVEAGAEIIVSGSGIFNTKNPADAVRTLKSLG